MCRKTPGTGREGRIRAVSEVVGTLILVAVVIVGIALAGILLFSNPTPARVPAWTLPRAGNSGDRPEFEGEKK